MTDLGYLDELTSGERKGNEPLPTQRDTLDLLYETLDKPQGTWDQILDIFGGFFDRPSKFVPAVGTGLEAWDAGKLLVAARRMRDGTSSQKDEDLVWTHMLEAGRTDQGWGWQMGSIMGESVAFMTEIALTSGVFTAGKKAALKLMGEAVEQAVEKTIKEAGSLTVRKALGEVVGTAAGAVRQSLAVPTRTFAAGIQRMIPELGLTQDEAGELAVTVGLTADDFWFYLKNSGLGVADTIIELFSEQAGGVVMAIPGSQKFHAGMARFLAKAFGREELPGVLKTLAKRGGWHGVLGEMTEEDIGRFLRAAFLDSTFNQEFDNYWEQKAIEAGAFTLQGGLMAGAGRLAYGKPKPGELSDKEQPDPQTSLETVLRATDEVLKNPDLTAEERARYEERKKQIQDQIANLGKERTEAAKPVVATEVGEDEQAALDVFMAQQGLAGLDEAKAAGARPVEPTTENQRWVDDYARSRGLRPIWVDAAGERMPLPAMYAEGGIVILDANAAEGLARRAVAYHELFHHLQAEDTELAQETARDIQALDPNGWEASRGRFAEIWKEVTGTDLDEDMLDAEGLSFYAQQLAGYLDLAVRDPAKLAALGVKDPTLLQRIRDFIVKLLNTLPKVHLRTTEQRQVEEFHRQVARTSFEREMDPETAREVAQLLAQALDSMLGASSPLDIQEAAEDAGGAGAPEPAPAERGGQLPGLVLLGEPQLPSLEPAEEPAPAERGEEAVTEGPSVESLTEDLADLEAELEDVEDEDARQEIEDRIQATEEALAEADRGEEAGGRPQAHGGGQLPGLVLLGEPQLPSLEPAEEPAPTPTPETEGPAAQTFGEFAKETEGKPLSVRGESEAMDAAVHGDLTQLERLTREELDALATLHGVKPGIGAADRIRRARRARERLAQFEQPADLAGLSHRQLEEIASDAGIRVRGQKTDKALQLWEWRTSQHERQKERVQRVIHEAAVRAAMQEGQEVPEDVLADYPELAAELETTIEEPDEVRPSVSGPSEEGVPSGAGAPGEAGNAPAAARPRPGVVPVEREPGGAGPAEGASGGPAVPGSGAAARPVQGDRPGGASEGADREPTGGSAGAANFRLDPSLLTEREGGWKTKAKENLAAIRLMKSLEVWGRPATAEEQDTLARYVGWGATELRQSIFPNVTTGKYRWETLGQELRQLLNDEEYADAKASSVNAHYTSPEVIGAIYRALDNMGFKGGRILEPGMGIGLFPALMPEGWGKSRYTGVELDAITARIAKLLFPKFSIRHEGFENFVAPDLHFDAVVGNPPFAEVKMSDKRYRKFKPSLHDYFFLKALDKLRPGGVLAFVTTRYTMDKEDRTIRDELSRKAELIGAIRLPRTAFKRNAGTEVVTDIIFLRKREAALEDAEGPWLTLQEVETDKGGVFINEWYSKHPEMVLGTHSLQGTMYSANEYTVLPTESPLESDLADAVARLHEIAGRKFWEDAPETGANQAAVVAEQAPENLKEGAFHTVLTKDGVQLFQKVEGVSQPADVSAAAAKKIQALIPLRDAARKVLHTQLSDASDEEMAEARQLLNDFYDHYVRAHGPINTTKVSTRTDKRTGKEVVTRRMPNLAPFQEDPDAPLVAALEKYDEQTGKAEKRDIFRERVINPPVEPTISGAQDALNVALNQTGEVHMPMIASLLGVSEDDAAAQLGDAVYLNPDGGNWETQDEYLSGNVRRKLSDARKAAKRDKRYTRNVEALEAVQPEDVPPSRISARLGAPWVPAADVAQFVHEHLGMPEASVSHYWKTASWSVDIGVHRYDLAARSTWGTEDKHTGHLLDALLNKKPIVVYVQGADPDTRVKSPERTTLAQQKAEQIDDAFSRWIWQDADRAARLSTVYNREYNNLRYRVFDGSHLSLPGISATAEDLFAHQKAVVWRIIQQGNVYMAHGVGAGKTRAMIAAAMEQRRLGLVKKPAIIVQGSTLRQFANEFLHLYPGANILVADEVNFSAKKRRRFVAQAATGNWDAVIFTHDSFDRLGVSPEREEKFLRQQMTELEDAVKATKGERQTQRDLQVRLQKLRERIRKLRDTKKDPGTSFEDTGIDYIFADEAQRYRKLDIITNQGNVKGVTTQGSKTAMDLYVKVLYLEERNPGRSLTMASGTPIVNTMGELYTVQRFLQHEELNRIGLGPFDAWASQFGRVVTDLEMNAAGGFQPVSRFKRFQNQQQLQQLVMDFMDYVSVKDLAYIKRPKVRTGRIQVVVGDKSELLKRYQKYLAYRMQKIRQRKGPPEKGEDIILTVINDGKLAAMDMRFVGRKMPSEPTNKLNKLVDNVFAIWERGKSKRLTQMVFSDIGTPGGQAEARRGFSAYRAIKQGLVERGVPESEVAFIQDYKTKSQRDSLFKAVNAGKVRVVIGTSEGLGTGVNAQERLVALHHLDAPWIPAYVEQRDGRILRQGNTNAEIDIFGYVTSGSYDATIWQLLEDKQGFIDQFFSGQGVSDEFDDVSVERDQMAMAKAVASGDPRVQEAAGLDREINKLQALRRGHMDEQVQLRQRKKSAEQAIPVLESQIADLKASEDLAADLTGDAFEAIVGEETLRERKKFGGKLINAIERVVVAQGDEEVAVRVGQIAGYSVLLKTMGVNYKKEHIDPYLLLQGSGKARISTRFQLGKEDPVGISKRLENAAKDGFERERAKSEGLLARHREDIRTADANIGKTFELEQHLADTLQRRKELEEEMAREKGEEVTETDFDIFKEPAGDPETHFAVPLSEEDWAGFDLPPESTLDILRRRLQDRFLRVRQLQQALFPEGDVTPDVDVSRGEELFEGRTEDRLETLEEIRVKPIMDLLHEAGISLEDAHEYLYARHAPRRNEVIAKRRPRRHGNVEKTPGSGMATSEANRIVKARESGDKGAAYKEIARLVRQLNRETLQAKVEYGLISDETAELWYETHGSDYVPLRTDVGERANLNLSRGFQVKGKESHKAKGRKTLADNVLVFSVMQAQETIIRGEKNRVGQRMLNLIRTHPNGESWGIRPGRGAAKVDVDGALRPDFDPAFQLAENAMTVKEDGKEFIIVFKDPLLARAMKRLGPQTSNGLVRALGAINRWLARVNTSLDPEFMLANYFRDLQTAGINLWGEHSGKLALTVMRQSMTAIRAIYNVERDPKAAGEWEDAFRRFRAAGAKVGFYHSPSFDAIADRMVEHMKQKDDGAAKRVLRDVFTWVSDANTAVENGVRLAAFKAALEQGMGEEEAASLAKNLTVNFNRKGEWGVLANSLYLFYNAGVQGTARMLSALRHAKVRKIAYAFIGAALALDVLNRVLGGFDDDGVPCYDKIPEWTKARRLILMIPGAPCGQGIAIPMPYGYNVFHAIGTNLGAVAFGGKNPVKAAKDVGNATWEAFMPIGSEATLAQRLSPTLTDPIVQLAENRTFYGAPIKRDQPAYEPPLPQSQLYWSSVNPALRATTDFLNRVTGGDQWSSGAIDINPETIEHWAEFWVGGFGRSVGRVWKTIAAATSEDQDLEIRNIPFIRRVYLEKEPQLDQRTFFENRDAVDAFERHIEGLRDTGRRDRAEDLRQENRGLWRLRAQLKAVESRLAPLRKRLRQADTPDERKRLQERIEREYVEFNKRFAEATRR